MSFKSSFYYTRTLLFLLLLSGSLGLRNVRIVVPESVERGKPLVIRCLYELENEELHQVKWYRGYREFCRYAPNEKPLLKMFPLPGLEVDPDGTDANQITIKAATEIAVGSYTCEISVEAPVFLSAQLHGFVKYLVELIWEQRLYKPGMKIKADCISYDSMPPANISFFINDEPARSENVWKRVSGSKNGSLWNSYGTLKFIVRKHHLITSRIRIRCGASIYNIYYKTHEQTAHAQITTTNAPDTWTPWTRVYPTRRVKENNAPSNRVALLVICLLSLIIVGQHFTE